MNHYTTILSRKQITIKWRDGDTREWRHYPRTDRGRASAQRTIDRLIAQGFVEGDPDAMPADPAACTP